MSPPVTFAFSMAYLMLGWLLVGSLEARAARNGREYPTLFQSAWVALWIVLWPILLLSIVVGAVCILIDKRKR